MPQPIERKGNRTGKAMGDQKQRSGKPNPATSKKRRILIERTRELLAENIKEARAEYDRGEVNRGTGEDLVKELSE